MTEVLTIFCCGTAVNRDGETAVTKLYRNCLTPRLILDGPGSARTPRYEDMKRIEDHGATLTDKVLLRKTRGTQYTRTASPVHKLGNQMTGMGTQDNIVFVMDWLLKKRVRGNILPYDVINIIGWSRGGVTGIKLSYAILADGASWHKSVQVNVFTFDPVPGALNDFRAPPGLNPADLNRWRAAPIDTLHRHLNSYHSILQENISSRMAMILPKDKNFVCVVPDKNGVDDYKLYPMPGDHGAACTSDSRMLSEEQIGMHLAQKFLQERGTTFMNIPNHVRSPRELVEIYSQVIMDGLGHGWNKETPSTHRNGPVENRMRMHPFYLNQHHQDLMVGQLPALSRFLQRFPPFGHQKLLPHTQLAELGDMQQQLINFPKTKKALNKIFPV